MEIPRIPPSFSEGHTRLGYGLSMPTRTDFFREQNDNDIALVQTALPEYLEQHPEVGEVRIVDVGCSNGMGVWSKAALLEVYGLPGTVLGIDVNPIVIGQATEPYHYTKRTIADRINQLGLPEECVDLFNEPQYGRVVPSATLHERVEFQVQDIRLEPLEPESADAITMNNVAQHYHWSMQGPLIGGAAIGLHEGGIFTANEGFTVPERIYDQHQLVLADHWRDLHGCPNFYQRKTAPDPEG
jgi:chemotaxis methyl-accepting protein methylase